MRKWSYSNVIIPRIHLCITAIDVGCGCGRVNVCSLSHYEGGLSKDKELAGKEHNLSHCNGWYQLNIWVQPDIQRSYPLRQHDVASLSSLMVKRCWKAKILSSILSPVAMSIIYCDKHDRHYDSDYERDCPVCEENGEVSIKRNCSVCNKVFDSFNGYVSCEEHSFGEVDNYYGRN